MAKCIKCGAVVSDEETRARYDELCKMGIIPQMVIICADCRLNAWAPSRDTGRYQGGYRTFHNGTVREDFGSDR